MSKLKGFALFFAGITFGILVIGQTSAKPAVRLTEDERRDGDWWKRQEKSFKYDYAIGAFDGMETGHRLTIKGLPKSKCGLEAIYSYMTSRDAFFNETTNGLIVDGLNEFYKDYRNRRILVQEGFWLVVNEISGTPRAQMDKMIETARKNAVN